ncbi:MAG: hypothetical protein R3C25_08850 [Hyphomonadaceae bacterium]
MSRIESSWAILFGHPILGGLAFVGIAIGLFVLLAGGQAREALGGVLRALLSIFTTPYTFLREALAIVGSAKLAEEDYAHSSVFILFRLNRIQYALLLLSCVVVLAGGVTSALISLYPSGEMARARVLDAEVSRLEAEVASASETLAAAAAPGFRENLDTQRSAADAAYQQQVQSNEQFLQSAPFSGGIVAQLANTNSADSVARLRADLDAYMSTCPRGGAWAGVSASDCGRYRTFVLELADRKDAEIRLRDAARDAGAAWSQADAAAQNANARLVSVQSQLEGARQQRASVSLFNPDWMIERIKSAAGVLLLSLWSVIVIVWIGASALSIFNWAILMMRGLERSQTEKLQAARQGEIR